MKKTIIVALLLAAAGCKEEAPQAEPAPPPDTAGGKPDLSQPHLGNQVAVIVTDTAIQMSSDSVAMVATGQISFSVQNKGTATKEIAIEGGELGRWTSTPIPPGGAVLMSMLMGRGKYEFVWRADKEVKKKFKVY